MNLEIMIKSLRLLSTDNRISVWHMGMYVAILQLWYQGGYKNPVAVTRRKILGLSHIGNIVTYHKCIKELEQYGYIRYVPSYHPINGSMVHLIF